MATATATTTANKVADAAEQAAADTRQTVRKATNAAEQAAADTRETVRKVADEAEKTTRKVADEADKAARKVADEASKVQSKLMDEFEAASQRARDLNEQILEGMKKQSLAAVDAYEGTLASVLDFQKKMADASQLDWVSALTDAHVEFVTSVSGAYTSTVREMLK